MFLFVEMPLLLGFFFCLLVILWVCIVNCLQGILGTDSRRYALDLFRIFPPDANHTPLEEEEGEKGEGGEKGEKGEGGERGEKGKGEGGERGEKGEGEGGEWGEGERKKGFRHKLAVLRPELLETFLQ